MYQSQFQTGQNDPDDIHYDGNSTTRWLGLTNFLAKWGQAKYGKFEALDSERDTDNGDA